ncbi:unnamed protein product [Oppiella nova]|uniref:Uncharacterized protein n=2 Tax=Oppiella nova TaxID=334625 RepID=A0A7R9M0X3_9ACAR|nr:unnamed protein product [Oppiella nova]CAG2168622.1 unnamed protein product [Oppiella nova]
MVTVMDTMGRFFESGTADGKHSSFGEYDECLELESPEDKGLVVKGQYCLVKVILPYPSVNSYKKGDPYDPTFDEEGITPFKYFNGGNFTSIIRMIENLNMYRGSTYRLEIYNIIYERSLAEDNTNLGETKFADEEPLHVNPYYYTFSLLGKLDRNGSKFNYFKYITGRYFRFAVPMLGSIIFLNTLPLMGSGPIWDEGVQWVTTPCQNPLVVLFGMLFISNYNDQFAIMERQSALPFCNPSTWFVSALFQLHVIIPILIIIYYKNAKYGAYATAGAIVLGMVSSISPTLIFNILPQMQYIQIESYEELFRSFAWYHLSTTQYIASFVVGVAGGYLIRRDWNLCIEYEVMGWCASVLAIIIVYMWSNTFWKVQKSAPLFSVLLWFTFGKLAFAIAITWIFFCLCTGRARTMDYLLSWPNFQPFSRLSFSFFMIHFMVVIRRVFTVKETITMSDGLLIENSIIDIMVTFCLAYVFYALIEAPFTNLMAIWLKKDTQRDDLVGHQNGAVHNKDTPAPEPKNSISMRDMGHIHHIELEEDINKNSNFVETIKI